MIGGVVVAGFAMLVSTSHHGTPKPTVATKTSPAVHARRAPVLAIAKSHAAALPVAFAAPQLIAKDRSAWRLSELVAIGATTEVHAKTSDGSDLVIADPEHALVVQRETGGMYVAWLVPGVADNDPRSLADLEGPAARIENVTELATSEQEREQAPAAAQIAVTIDGAPASTLTATAFAKLATAHVEHDGTRVAALDLGAAYGRAALVAVEADGAPVDAQAPDPSARPVIFMNKRERFNFAWVDAAGKPLGDKHREVTLVALRTR